MLDSLSARMERSFKLLKGEGRITEINVAETLKEVRRALLDADVNYKTDKNFSDSVKQKALGQKILAAVMPGQMMVKIVHDELVDLMGLEDVFYNPVIIALKQMHGIQIFDGPGFQIADPVGQHGRRPERHAFL